MTDHRRAILASAPTRLDFGGGWTDVPPYPEERGGFVCAIAISRRATVRIRPGRPTDAATDPLVRAALRRAGVADIDVSLTSDFPVGAGLGGSSAAGVALAAALHRVRQLPTSPAMLAEWSRAVEVEELGIAGGRQDHYTAALQRQCLLYYTGESRISATTISAVLDAYRDRVPRVVDALGRMAQLARAMRDALVGGDISTLAELVAEHWIEQRSLHPGITTLRIDAIERAARAAGATAIKALGASGGGCVIVLAPEAHIEAVTGAVDPLAERLAWEIDDDGVRVSDLD
jgi:D-glycero-alpha-D-manno-heptose-7-phosphate kinase